MSKTDYGSLAGGILGGIAGIIDSGLNYSINKDNLDMQKDYYNYQKDWNNKIFNYQQELNNTLMQREDTAVQRRAKDLEAAGMSKWLAAGQGASSTLASAGTTQNLGSAPQNNYRANLGKVISDVVNVIGSIKGTQVSDSQRDLNNANADKSSAEADNVRAKTETEITKTRAEIDSRTDLNRQQKKNLQKQIDEIQSRVELNQAQTFFTKTGQTKLLNEIDLIRSQIDSNNYDNIIKDYNYEWSKRRGIRTNDPMDALTRDILNAVLDLDGNKPSKNIPKSTPKAKPKPKVFKNLGKVMRFVK